MRSISTTTELILTIDKKDFNNLNNFLQELNLRDGNGEILDYKTWTKEDAWSIESEDKEELIIIFGKEVAHVILKKNQAFKQLREKFLKYIKF